MYSYIHSVASTAAGNTSFKLASMYIIPSSLQQNGEQCQEISTF